MSSIDDVLGCNSNLDAFDSSGIIARAFGQLRRIFILDRRIVMIIRVLISRFIVMFVLIEFRRFDSSLRLC